MASIDNAMNVVTRLFLEILSRVQLLTLNSDLSTKYKDDKWTE